MTVLNRATSPRRVSFARANEAVTDSVAKLAPSFATTR